MHWTTSLSRTRITIQVWAPSVASTPINLCKWAATIPSCLEASDQMGQQNLLKAKENNLWFHKSIPKIWILKLISDGSSKSIKQAEVMQGLLLELHMVELSRMQFVQWVTFNNNLSVMYLWAQAGGSFRVTPASLCLLPPIHSNSKWCQVFHLRFRHKCREIREIKLKRTIRAAVAQPAIEVSWILLPLV